MTAVPHALIHVQHLLGIGHLKRAAALARALVRRGLSVTIVSGGMPVPDLDTGRADLVQLPSVRSADTAFSALLDEAGAPVDEDLLARRKTRLTDTFAAIRPDVVVTETYPFGRRKLAGEFDALLQAAAGALPRPLILASVRDVLQTGRKPARTAEAVQRVRMFYDAVLVHGDPCFARFEETFPAAAEIADRCIYTGFVDTEAPPSPGKRPAHGEVIVSAGGGAVGRRLLEIAIRAGGTCDEQARRPWRCLVGHNIPEAEFRAARRRAGPGVIVERNRPDFRSLLAGAAVSVSQAGYNTMLDVLAARVPAVLVPFAEGGQSEQTFRAERLAAKGFGIVLPEAELTPRGLGEAVERVRRYPPPDMTFDRRGAEAVADIVVARLAERRTAAG